MKKQKIIVSLTSLICAFFCILSPFKAKTVAISEDTVITCKNNPELWERFLKYDLCVLDYDSLTDEKKELCKFIFETELNSEETIICERARRILNGYDVGRRVTIEDTENYYDFKELFSFDYNFYKENIYLYSVPDIKHLDWYNCYNEYWVDDAGNKRILSTGETKSNLYNTMYIDCYYYEEFDDNGNLLLDYYITRNSNNLNIIKDDNFKYIIYPNNTLYVYEPIDKNLLSYIVPEKIDNMKVIGIKAYAFENLVCNEITLPDSIKYIEPFAFNNCSNLYSINIPKDIRYIGAFSLAKCSSLDTLTVDCPDAVIGTGAFNDSKINSLFLNIKNINSSLLTGFNSLSSIKSIELGDDIIKIGTVFANKTVMNKYGFSIPKNVKYITDDFFSEYNSYYTDELVIPNNIEVFGAYDSPIEGEYILSNIQDSSTKRFNIIENECDLKSNTVISGYYGTEAHNYALSHNLKFNPLEDINYGDSNKDGEINIADVVSLQKYLFGIGNVGYEADLTKDGIIDSFDMVLMRKMILSQ